MRRAFVPILVLLAATVLSSARRRPEGTGWTSARMVAPAERADQPEIIPTEAAAAYFPAKEQRSLARFRIGQCLRVRRVELEEA